MNKVNKGLEVVEAKGGIYAVQIGDLMTWSVDTRKDAYDLRNAVEKYASNQVWAALNAEQARASSMPQELSFPFPDGSSVRVIFTGGITHEKLGFLIDMLKLVLTHFERHEQAKAAAEKDKQPVS